MSKTKYYVVWEGVTPGIYENWEECKKQIENYAGAKYKSFDKKEKAERALRIGYLAYKDEQDNPIPDYILYPSENSPILESISVDAACSGNPGDMEYRGVYTKSGKELFRIGPLKMGTNNVGEFLAIVHGLALLKQRGSPLPIYTDSRNAMSWVRQKVCKTKLERLPENKKIFELIERAEKWLKTNTYTTPIYKWETKEWGEIPADFGRK